jgi:hypothetical protein
MVMIAGWAIGLVIGLVFLWFFFQVAIGFLISPVASGRAILKQKFKELGTDVSRIPDAAWTELVETNLEHAKFVATLRQNENWRSLFIQALEAEAVLVTELMRGAADPVDGELTRQTLVRYGVLGRLKTK